MARMHALGSVVSLIAVATILSIQGAKAQDALKVDSTHTKAIFENDQVRVFRVMYAPHEKGAMHSHPNGLAVFLTDISLRFTLPDGKTLERSAKAGEAAWLPATTHLVENVGGKRVEMIHVELKSPPPTK